MGDVYLGQHIEDQSEVALKVFNAYLTREEDQRAFLEEAQALHLEHPHIMPLLDCGVGSNHMPFVVMEYAPHGTLRSRHTKGLQMPLEDALSYILPLASALQYAHEQEKVHGNIKSGNMLLDAEDKILLSDFELATVRANLASSEAQDAAPEERMSAASPASDQFALGVVIYEWLCGKSPFQGAEDEEESPSLRALAPHLTLEVEQVVQRALASDPEQRFANMRAFAEALEAASQPERGLLPFAPTEPEEASAEAAPDAAALTILPNSSIAEQTGDDTVLDNSNNVDNDVNDIAVINNSNVAKNDSGNSNSSDNKKRYFALASIGLVMLILLGSVFAAGTVEGVQFFALPLGVTGLVQNQPTPQGTSLIRDLPGYVNTPGSTATPTNQPTSTSNTNNNNNNNNGNTNNNGSNNNGGNTSNTSNTNNTHVTPTPTPTSKPKPTPTPTSKPKPTPTPTPKPIVAAVDGKNPTTYTVNGKTCEQTLSNSHSKHVTIGGVGATVYFRFSVTCHAAWAKIVFDKPLASGKYGNAKIVRINDGKAYTCNTGGNKAVAPGQTSCYTGMVQDNASQTASAYGNYMSSWSSQLGPY